MSFPATRMRRLRRTPRLRAMVRETRLAPDQLILPLFVHTLDAPAPVDSMPGVSRWPVKQLADRVRDARKVGIGSIILFGIPEVKDAEGCGAFARDGVIQQAIASVKNAHPDMVVIADTCLDEFTDHGHCGVLKDGEVDNDATLEVLAQVATSQAEAGADLVAPSDMMDGRVGHIRGALDRAGFHQVGIMAYAAKYASAFYGPFREAADSAPQFGDRCGYQMDPANSREALAEGALDLAEGADILMVKPALAYLDIIRSFRDTFQRPIAAYNVSGEYAMVKAAGANGWIDEERVMMEVLTSIRRAGADMIISYHATEAARLLG